MRYTRGLVQSLGAGGSLLAAAACALLAISAAVGFRGWPGLDRGSDARRDLVVAAGAAHPRAQRAGRPSGEFVTRRLVLATGPAPAPTRHGARRAPAAPAPTRMLAAAQPAPAAPSTSPAPASAPAPGARRLTTPVSDAVRGTGRTAGTTLAPVSPTVARTVTDATDTVAGLVDKTGDALAP